MELVTPYFDTQEDNEILLSGILTDEKIKDIVMLGETSPDNKMGNDVLRSVMVYTSELKKLMMGYYGGKISNDAEKINYFIDIDGQLTYMYKTPKK